jgi:hypothetical protein
MRHSLTILLFIFLQLVASSQHTPMDEAPMLRSEKLEILKSDITQLHKTKFRWFAEEKLDSIASLLHPDLNYIHSNGWVETKSEVLDNIQSGKLTYHSVEVLKADVTISGQTAVLLGTGIFSVSLNGKPILIKLLYTEVYTDIDKRPVLIHRHACKLE